MAKKEKVNKQEKKAAAESDTADAEENKAPATPEVSTDGATETASEPESAVVGAEEEAAESEVNADEATTDIAKDVLKGETPDLPDFTTMLAEAAASSIEILNDVELDVKIELGRTELTVEEVLQLTKGSVVELNKLAGDPVDVLVNEQLIARGEILVVNDNFCVRLNEIIPGVSERVNQD